MLVRNPQSAIMLTAESLIAEAQSAESIFSQKHVEFFQLIHSSSEFVSSLLEGFYFNLVHTYILDVLNFQRLSENKIILSIEPFELRPFLENLSLFLRKMIPLELNLSFETNFSCDLPCIIYGDKFRIRQIITNFVSNAAKFTHSGKISFFVEVLDRNESDECPLVKNILFSVKDSGVGISPENTVFDSILIFVI